MTSSTHIATPGQSRSQDTLRWGGMLGVPIDATPSTAGLTAAIAQAMAKSGSQLVNAHWRWPLTWGIALVLTPQGAIAGDVSVQFAITIGSGDAQQTILRTVTIPNGSADSAIDNALILPACDLLIRPQVLTTTDSHPVTGPGSLEIGAFVAPQTEPHAMLEMLACMCRIEGASNADQRRDGWMGPGFNPEPLGYGR